MCGLFGFTFKDEKLLVRGLETLRHRGPDDRNYYLDEKISLGHHRLSIIDLSERARQPMSDDANEVIIAYNGELYNFKELRDILIGDGCQFRSQGDTEVILSGYKKYGLDFISKMRGMWAAAIYDKKNGKILLCRDFFGIKPLYYAVENDIFYFSSEIKALKKILKNLEPNSESYYQFFNLGYFCAPQTCYKNVYKVRPGEAVIWDINKKTITKAIINFFNKDFDFNERKLNLEESVELMNRLLLDSVKAHFVSDVPVGLLLSGGNDSSLIAALSASLGKRPISYHLSVKGSTDSSFASGVARHLNLELRNFEMTDKTLEEQYEKIWQIADEPFSDLSIIPTSLIYSCIGRDTKVVLSGEGGDEIFGGYVRHSLFSSIDKVELKNFTGSIFNLANLGTSALSLNLLTPISGRIYDFIIKSGFYNDIIGTYLRTTKIINYPVKYEKIRSYLYDFYNESEMRHYVQPNLFFDLFLHLPNSLMYKNDISSMAYSIEARVPFLDKFFLSEILEKVEQKYLLSSQYQSKFLLKKVMEKYLPPKLIYRDKKGFAFSYNLYGKKNFLAELKEALKFHNKNYRMFGIDKNFLNIIKEKNSELLLRKYPRFAFALVSNWKIFKDM